MLASEGKTLPISPFMKGKLKGILKELSSLRNIANSILLDNSKIIL